MTIAENLAIIQQRIKQAQQQYPNTATKIQLIAVSKTRSANDIETAYQAGQTHFAESYVQEAIPKIQTLAHLPLTWHFIGPIQSNKTQAIAQYFNWVHSVARLKIARRLSQQRLAKQTPLNICIQVNISQEAQKSGIFPQDLPQLVKRIQTLPQLKLQGLMGIASPCNEFSQQQQQFHQLNQLQQQYDFMNELSMGMSNDLEAAISKGATLLRIGSAIFGKRQ